MKTIGLLGGMSWESTIPYYRIINEEVRNRLGGLHSAKIILHSVEFDEIERCQFERIICELQAQGAEGVILGCTEIGLLTQQENSVLRVFDTTELHAKRAVELALAE